MSATDPPLELYRGTRNTASSVALVLVEEVATGEILGPLDHRVRYSPTGLNWGYQGAGPRDLARSLLAAAVGDEAACPGCRGAARGADCPACFDGLRSDLPDEELVRDIVCRLETTWVLHQDQLRAWWALHRPDLRL